MAVQGSTRTSARRKTARPRGRAAHEAESDSGMQVSTLTRARRRPEAQTAQRTQRTCKRQRKVGLTCIIRVEFSTR